MLNRIMDSSHSFKTLADVLAVRAGRGEGAMGGREGGRGGEGGREAVAFTFPNQMSEGRAGLLVSPCPYTKRR